MKENITKCSWIGRFFQWIDDNILSKTTRLWMYVLEIVGIVTIFIMIGEFRTGFELILKANTDLELQKAHMFIEAVRGSAGPIASMVATICGAIPAVMATFRSLKKKWNGNYTKNNEENNKVLKK